MGVHAHLVERRVWRALELARDEREVLGQHVVISALREFRGHARAPAEFVEVAVARNIFVIEGEGAVGLPGGAGLPVAAPLGRLQAIAALHGLEGALRIDRVGVGVDRVDRIAVGRPTDMGHLCFSAGEPRDEQGREAVIMVGSVRLDVAMVLVEAESGRDPGGRAHLSVALERLVAPKVAPVAIVKDFGGAGVEDHAVQGDPPGVGEAAGLLGRRLGSSGHLEPVFLLGDGIRVTPVGERGDLVVRYAVGFDDPLIPLEGDRDLVLGGRGAVGDLEGRAGRQQGYRQ